MFVPNHRNSGRDLLDSGGFSQYNICCLMGSVQSYDENNPSDNVPKVIKIERSEIPEEYKTVAVSHDVINQILNLRNAESDSDTVRDLRKQLSEEQEVNLKLREQVKNLSESFSLQKTASGNVSIAELRARKDAFDETLDRVEKQYFSYHPENVCKAIETDLMECITKNKNKILNCASFAADLTKCANDFRESVLKEVSHL
ncbi:unnamed protein product [Litomosoides sigmodontis]|uniref:MICOS complex subunit MIC19 n=1 Tax=Litomosoides sigmodontis TaxID=42156 RepID=A0A3P6U5F3_LITSI|nr:unnamed protein product [Litomosoides sigmodontis]